MCVLRSLDILSFVTGPSSVEAVTPPPDGQEKHNIAADMVYRYTVYIGGDMVHRRSIMMELLHIQDTYVHSVLPKHRHYVIQTEVVLWIVRGPPYTLPPEQAIALN